MLLISGCSFLANRQALGHPATPEIDHWRQYLGFALALQYLLLTWALWKTVRRKHLSRVFLGFLLVPLAWTILGEWTYRLQIWVLGLGCQGKVLAGGASFVLGLTGGNLNIYPYALGALVFNDSNYLLYWALPGFVSAYAAIAVFLSGRELVLRKRVIPTDSREGPPMAKQDSEKI